MIGSTKKEVNESILLMNDSKYMYNHSVYRNIDKMMAFGGDNFKGLCDELDVSGEKAYTVCGSGDQSLELVGRGFTLVDAFDINLLARHMLNLKIAAIKALEYDEFMIFSRKMFRDLLLFEKISAFLNPETKKYFEYLFTLKDQDSVYKNLMTHCYTGYNAIIKACQTNFSFYMPKGFYIVKDKLLNSQINFKERNLFELQNLKDNYDFIYFSNILIFNSMNILDFKKELLPNYIEHLNSNGILALHYMHYFVGCRELSANSSKDRSIQKLNEKILKELSDIANIKVVLEPSHFGRGIGEKDMVLALKKRK